MPFVPLEEARRSFPAPPLLVADAAGRRRSGANRHGRRSRRDFAGSAGPFRTVNTPKLYAGIGISMLGLAAMWGESEIPWLFHIAIVLFVWGGVLIGLALRGQ